MTAKNNPAPLTAADVQTMIDDALKNYGEGQSTALKEFGESVAASFDERDKSLNARFDELAEQQKTRFDELGAAAEGERQAWAEGLEKLGKAQQTEFLAKFDEMLAGAEQRKADAAAGQAKADDAAKAKESARQVKADKAAAAALEKQQRADAAAAAKRIDRAARDYAALVGKPVASALTPATAQTITMRLGDGSTFHPEHELELETADLQDDVGRQINAKVIDLPGDLAPFTASEAILIVEGGKDPVALYRSAIESPLRFGGGASAQLAVGALAFRRLSPEPETASA